MEVHPCLPPLARRPVPATAPRAAAAQASAPYRSCLLDAASRRPGKRPAGAAGEDAGPLAADRRGISGVSADRGVRRPRGYVPASAAYGVTAMSQPIVVGLTPALPRPL